MIRAIIFDMDGLLLDSEVYWARARTEYCRDLGCTWREEDELGVKGANSPEWAEVIRRRCRLDSNQKEIIDAVSARMRQLYHERLPLLPGALKVVRSLAGRYPLAIASSSPPSLIEFAMAEAGLRSSFRVVVSADDTGRGKPAPDVFLAAAKRLRFSPQEIAVFEDSSAGIQAARAAGMAVIAVPNAHYPPDEKSLREAKVVLTSLEDFQDDML
jgi:HAD superfamily hydrolase (TIGR01509 family)